MVRYPTLPPRMVIAQECNQALQLRAAHRASVAVENDIALWEPSKVFEYR